MWYANQNIQCNKLMGVSYQEEPDGLHLGLLQPAPEGLVLRQLRLQVALVALDVVLGRADHPQLLVQRP